MGKTLQRNLRLIRCPRLEDNGRMMDDGLLELMRDELDGQPVREKRMFGGVAFMLHGNMVCGVHGHGVFFRVGKDAAPQALALPGVQPFALTGRPMGGLVDADDEAMANDDLRARLTTLSLAFAKSLPPK